MMTRWLHLPLASRSPWPVVARFGRAALAAVALAAVTTPAHAGPRRVEVDGDRILLGHLVRGAPRDLAGIDLGPAPPPGQSLVVRGEQIRRRLRQALVEAPGLRIPPRLRVVRPGRRLSELELQRLVRQSLGAQLPAGATLERLRLDGGMVLPRGELRLRVTPVGKWRNGANTLRLTVTAGASPARIAHATAVVDLPVTPSTPVVRRGERVVITARAPGVELRTQGVAQRDGAAGDLIPVLPSAGERVLQARVREDRSVEVEL